VAIRGPRVFDVHSSEEVGMLLKTVSVLLLFAAVAIPHSAALAQECGPGCPACSGKATGDLLTPGAILASGLFIPDAEEETIVTRLGYGVLPWMDVGIGYAVDTEEVIWSARVQPVTQDREGWRPALIVGTGSVQTGGSDQSAYVQLAKALEVVEGRFGVSASAGYATDLPDLEESWGLATAALVLFDRVSPFYAYDGVNSHVGLSYFATDWLTVTGYYLEMEEPAVMLSLQWAPGEDEDDDHDDHGHVH
jgi:hypothetical protein